MAEIEIENGILGVKRDILINLVDLMIFRRNSLIRKVSFFSFFDKIFFIVDRNEWRKCVLDQSFPFCSGTNLA
jgi:hypothetical protein